MSSYAIIYSTSSYVIIPIIHHHRITHHHRSSSAIKHHTYIFKKQFMKKSLPKGPEHHLGVSKNSGIPESSILIGFPIINHPFWSTPIFGNTYLIILIHVKSNKPSYHLHRDNNRRSFGGPMCNILGMSIPGTNGNSRDISLFFSGFFCAQMCSDVRKCAEQSMSRYSKIHHQDMNRLNRSTLSSMKWGFPKMVVPNNHGFSY